MKFSSKFIAALVAITLAGFGAGLAAQSQTPAKPASAQPAKPAAAAMTATGTVVSSTATSLVISVKGKEKAEELTFVLQPATVKEGELAAGAKVHVEYKSEAGQNVATSVKVVPAKAKPAKPAK
jgi:hypothetical protein